MKKCVTCKEEKTFENFNKHSGRKDGYQSVCRDCNRARSKRYYAENTEEHKTVTRERNREYKAKTKLWFKEYKSQLSCVQCGEDRAPTLDFHHTDPTEKDYTVASMVGNGLSLNTIMTELNKCIVLCSNCHRMLHYELNSNGFIAQ